MRPVQIRVADCPDGEWKTETVQAPDRSKPSPVEVAELSVPLLNRSSLPTGVIDLVRDGALPPDLADEIFGWDQQDDSATSN
jgi:hypothetical protein